MRGETHEVFVDPEDLEILQVHLVDRVELGLELRLGAVEVRVVHLHRTHAHQAEKLARLLVAVAGAVFGQAQREVAVTARDRTKDLVVVRAVHGFEIDEAPLEYSIPVPEQMEQLRNLRIDLWNGEYPRLWQLADHGIARKSGIKRTTP